VHNKGFRQLVAWQKAHALTVKIYQVTRDFPREELFALTSQIRRSSSSVGANLAEGYSREHKKEYLHFLSIARGSLAETENFLLLAKDLGYLGEGEYGQIEEQREEVGRVLNGLINSLKDN